LNWFIVKSVRSIRLKILGVELQPRGVKAASASYTDYFTRHTLSTGHHFGSLFLAGSPLHEA